MDFAKWVIKIFLDLFMTGWFAANLKPPMATLFLGFLIADVGAFWAAL